ncbi:hypothetical protein MNBD_GAMMA09-3854 [hydrothermal vent metagenome]|uniref:ABM domain-containing protein n=1 Tax=hydrothermal vent metagenome TaxID=652676 RepID=A0A3B0XDY6_9ZZZZ
MINVNILKTLLFFVFTALNITSLALYADTQSEQKISRISSEAEILTMVNVLTPPSGKQQEIIQLLQAGMHETLRHQAGFISANIHKSLDSEHVLVYAQWEDQASVDAAAELVQNGEAPTIWPPHLLWLRRHFTLIRSFQYTPLHQNKQLRPQAAANAAKSQF